MPKIAQAESHYKDMTEKFLSKRMAMKDQVKESAGLGNLERQVKKLQGNIFDSPRENKGKN